LPSFSQNANAPILNTKSVEAFTRWYAGDIDIDDAPPTLAPARANNFSGSLDRHCVRA
jgi:acetyl esterase